MTTYNDGLNNETEVQIISTYRRPTSQKTKNIIKDLGTVPNSLQNLEITLGSAEMYNNTNILDLDCYSYTFQQSSENGCVAEPRIAAQKTSTRSVGEKKEKENVFGSLVNNGSGPKNPNEPKRLNPNDLYTNISVAVNNIRIGERYDRMNMYISVQEANDVKYSIFLRGNLTSAHDEILRSINSKNNNDYLRNIYDTMVNTYPNCLLGRLRYNPGKKKSNLFYKKNIKTCLAAVFQHNNQFKCHLHLVGVDYIFDLTDKFMSAKQKQVYDMMGYFAQDLDDTE